MGVPPDPLQDFQKPIEIFLFLKHPVTVVAAVRDMINKVGQSDSSLLGIPPPEEKPFNKLVSSYLFLKRKSGPVPELHASLSGGWGFKPPATRLAVFVTCPNLPC